MPCPNAAGSIRAVRRCRVSGTRSNRCNPLKSFGSLTIEYRSAGLCVKAAPPHVQHRSNFRWKSQQGHTVTGRQFPRHACRGLIEARPVAGRKHLAVRRFPRHACRGLIEACIGTMGPGTRVFLFPRHACRGLIEAQVTNRKAVGRLSQFPRHACRGLIEAHGTGYHRLSRFGFRGMRAAASLKPRSAIP